MPKQARRFKTLQQLFREGRSKDDDETWRKFGDWLHSLFAPGGLLQPRSIDCRHTLLRPEGMKPCGTSGTHDADKGAGMRYSTLKKDAELFIRQRRGGRQSTLSFVGASSSRDLVQTGADVSSSALGIEGVSAVNTDTSVVKEEKKWLQASTKMRVAHFAILYAAFGSARDIGKLKQAFKQLKDSTIMVLHNCGCGLNDCIEPTHLRFGTRKDNDMDKTYHEVLRAPMLEGVSSNYHNLILEFRKKQSGRFVL